MIKIILSFLICANLVAQTHSTKIYIDPSFGISAEETVNRAQSYLDDINFILAKNTTHNLILGDIIETPNAPQSNAAPIGGFSSNPNFNIDFFVHKNTYQTGGYPAFNGEAHVIAVEFKDFYDKKNLTAGQEQDYLLHLHIFVHEFGHIFGVAIGEYYRPWLFSDQTGIYPILPPIDPYADDDVFWHKRYDFLTDPLLTFPAGGYWGHFSRQDYLDFVQFSNLSARIINRGLRYPTWQPAESSILTIEVCRNGRLLKNARVRLFVANQLILDSKTDSAGHVSIQNPLTMFDQICIIKVEHGFSLGADYVSHWDIQNAGTLGYNELVYRINL